MICQSGHVRARPPSPPASSCSWPQPGRAPRLLRVQAAGSLMPERFRSMPAKNEFDHA